MADEAERCSSGCPCSARPFAAYLSIPILLPCHRPGAAPGWSFAAGWPLCTLHRPVDSPGVTAVLGRRCSCSFAREQRLTEVLWDSAGPTHVCLTGPQSTMQLHSTALPLHAAASSNAGLQPAFDRAGTARRSSEITPGHEFYFYSSFSRNVGAL